MDILPEFRPDFDEDDDCDFDEEDETEDSEPETPADEREPVWSLRLVLNKGGEKTQTFYNQMHDEPQELFWALMEWFEPDEDESFEELEYDEDLNK